MWIHAHATFNSNHSKIKIIKTKYHSKAYILKSLLKAILDKWDKTHFKTTGYLGENVSNRFTFLNCPVYSIYSFVLRSIGVHIHVCFPLMWFFYYCLFFLYNAFQQLAYYCDVFLLSFSSVILQAQVIKTYLSFTALTATKGALVHMSGSKVGSSVNM